MLLIFTLVALGTGTLFAQTASEPSGSGTSLDPYLIATLNNLYWISENCNSSNHFSGKYFKQTANIDATDTFNWYYGWHPIGRYNSYFAGIYDGQNYTISNLTIRIRVGNLYPAGLFSKTSSPATIKNLGVTNVNLVDGIIECGALVGRIDGNTTITNCYSSGSISGGSYVGGLIGYNYDNDKLVSNSHSSANVTGGDYVGGFVGATIGILSHGIIRGCYSTGNVSGIQYTGGFAGMQSAGATLSNCYSHGNVTRWVGSNTTFGGFVGENYWSIVEYCYSTGDVTCGSETGLGFLGSHDGIATANFWDSEASNQSTATGATAKTTAQMKTHTTFTAAGWDFELETANGTDDNWDMDYSGSNNNGYPYLSWEDGGDVSLPVELVSFSAHAKGRSIILNWITESETDNTGFILDRSEEGEEWIRIASYQTHDALKGQGNTSSRTEYTFTDHNVEFGKKYAYRLSDMSIGGEVTMYPSLSVRMDDLPETTEMENAYPNPFNPQTFIGYRLSEDAQVEISVFDMLVSRQVNKVG